MKHSKRIAISAALMLAVFCSGCTVSNSGQSLPVGETTTSAQSAAPDAPADSAAETSAVQDDGNAAADPAQSDTPAPASADPAAQTPAATDAAAQQGGQQNAQPDAQQNAAPGAQTFDDGSGKFVVGSGLTVGVGTVHARAGQKAVPVTFRIWNNPGFSMGGFKITYDPVLVPLLAGTNDIDAKFDLSPAISGATAYGAVNFNTRAVAVGIFNPENLTAEGALFTVYFDIPENAQPGTAYSLKVEADSITDAQANMLDFTNLDGEIRID
ncbi:MAG: hypothetical protein K5705_14065 [Oscillospiraceae bacterium]|nr:hypothetical protein [Oscillospiraceae bacterium]